MIDNNDKNSLNSALLDAAWLGNLIVVESMLKAGADVNAKSKNGLTPLHLAAYCCHLRVVKALIEAGADVNSKNKRNWTPLHGAANMNMDYVEIVRVLIQAGADFNMKTQEGSTAMHIASHGCHVAIRNLLNDCGAQEDDSVNAINY